MSVAMPFPPGPTFPVHNAVWPEGEISFENATAVAVALAQIPLVPSMAITNAIASTLSEISAHTPPTIVVLGVLNGEDLWQPIGAGSSFTETGIRTNHAQFADSITVPLGASGAVVEAASNAYVFNEPSKARSQYLEVVARSKGTFAQAVSVTTASSQPGGHVVGVVWDGTGSALSPLATSYLRCLMARVLDVVDSAFPSGIMETPMLSMCELSVIRMLLMGKTVQEIARLLNRSRYTVHDHVKSIYRKLGVHSRGELFYRVGLLEAEALF